MKANKKKWFGKQYKLAVVCLSGTLLVGCMPKLRLQQALSEIAQETETESETQSVETEKATVASSQESGAETEKRIDSAMETEEVTEETEAATETEPETKSVVNNPENSAARMAYRKFLQPIGMGWSSVYDEMAGYDRYIREWILSERPDIGFLLIDIDGDGLDEMIFENNTGPYSYRVYTYEDGEVKEIGSVGPTSGGLGGCFYDEERNFLFLYMESRGSAYVNVLFRDEDGWWEEGYTCSPEELNFLDMTLDPYPSFREGVPETYSYQEFCRMAQEREWSFVGGVEEAYQRYQDWITERDAFLDRFSPVLSYDAADERKLAPNTATNRLLAFQPDSDISQRLAAGSLVEEARPAYATFVESGKGDDCWVEGPACGVGADSNDIYIDHGDFYEVLDSYLYTTYRIPAEIMQQCTVGYSFTIYPDGQARDITVDSVGEHSFGIVEEIGEEGTLYYSSDSSTADDMDDSLEGTGYIVEANNDFITNTAVYYGNLCFSKDCVFYSFWENVDPVGFDEFVNPSDKTVIDFDRGFPGWFYGTPVFDPETGLITEFYSSWRS